MQSDALSFAIAKQDSEEKNWWAVAVAYICDRDGITKERLARALGVSVQCFWQWRAGLAMPTREHFLKVRALASDKIRVKGRRLVAAAEY